MLKIKQLLAVILSLIAMQSACAMNKNILKVAFAVPKCAIAYTAMQVAGNVGHELGHAIPHQTFFGNVVGLNFFGDPKIVLESQKFFLGIGTNIHGGSACHFEHNALSSNAEKIKAMITLAAGPVAGAASALLSKKLLYKTSVNKKFLTWTTGFDIFDHLSNLIPYYKVADKPKSIVSHEYKESDQIISSSDGFKLCNVYRALKANKSCNTMGEIIYGVKLC